MMLLTLIAIFSMYSLVPEGCLGMYLEVSLANLAKYIYLGQETHIAFLSVTAFRQVAPLRLLIQLMLLGQVA